MNRISVTGVKGIQHNLIDVSKDQLDAGIGQQLADKSATNIACSKM